jgi:hypothetical protein
MQYLLTEGAVAIYKKIAQKIRTWDFSATRAVGSRTGGAAAAVSVTSCLAIMRRQASQYAGILFTRSVVFSLTAAKQPVGLHNRYIKLGYRNKKIII